MCVALMASALSLGTFLDLLKIWIIVDPDSHEPDIRIADFLFAFSNETNLIYTNIPVSIKHGMQYVHITNWS